ncbi:unnamed protein product [Trifolium pratense]|uniref:Uncharacterized protein n=1 Tax=Trifolium pratense TaxID=57577 RepID=A0ACB0LWF9_TRIPR|nr:unnamed protein product [Trifolium pratense]
MTSEENIGISQDFGMEEDDEDLFEIDLEAVNYINPPLYNFWENNHFISTGEALLANCLLPKSHISSAIPACNNNNAVSLARNTNVFVITEPKPLGEYLRLPFLGDFGLIVEKMNAKFYFQFQT